MANPQFLTTHWSVVLRAADRSDPDRQQAMATLCENYWYPVYVYLRRRGQAPQEAEDLTQEFFVRLLERDFLEAANPDKGKFRSFLLVCVKRFLINRQQHDRAQKRGGGQVCFSFDAADADARYQLEPPDNRSPELLFQRRWALTLLKNALHQLANEMQQEGKQAVFDKLKIYLAAEDHAPSYDQIAAETGMTAGAVRVAVHRLRQRYRRLLREEIAATLDDPQDIDDEVRWLFQVLQP